jgi:prevent-host-death family protein
MRKQAAPVPAAEVQKRFGYYQDEAIKGPVLISKNGRAKTVLLSCEEYARLKRRDRRAYKLDDAPAGILDAIIAAEVPADLPEE